MRVNFILPTFIREPIGGYKVIYDHANFLVSRGHRVRIIFPHSATAEPFWGLEGQLRGWAWALKTQAPAPAAHNLASARQAHPA